MMHFDKFRISDALMTTYKLVWNDFCSWYLEMIKPGYEQPIDDKTYESTLQFFEKLLKLMHPFTPFVTEEIWHLIRERKDGNDIIIEKWPKAEKSNDALLKKFELTDAVITNIRNIRKQNNIASKIKIDLKINVNKEIDKQFDSVIIKMGNLSSLEYAKEKLTNGYSFIVESNEYFIPFGDDLDIDAEIEKIETELKYTKGFLASVNGKLSNQKFVAGAPDEVVAIERKKAADAENKIQLLEDKLKGLKK